MRAVSILVLGILAAAASAQGKKDGRKVDEKAMAALVRANSLACRPLAEGLRDVSLAFDVETSEGRMQCLWLYRAATKDAPARELATVTNQGRKGRAFAALLADRFTMVRTPVLLGSFVAMAEGMDVAWKEDPDRTVLTPTAGAGTEDGEAPEFTAITLDWNEEGLPSRITWTRTEEDPEEGPYKVEVSSSFTWKKEGTDYVIASLNSNREGPRVIAKYEYAKTGPVLLPKKIERVNPLAGTEVLEIRETKVNEGLSDEEFDR